MSRQRFEYRNVTARATQTDTFGHGHEYVNDTLDYHTKQGWEVHSLLRDGAIINILFSRRVGPLYAGSEVARIAGEHKISAQPVAGNTFQIAFYEPGTNPDCYYDQHQGTVQPAVASYRFNGLPVCQFHMVSAIPVVRG